ncbi:ornithine cyclodeaminase [Marinomonas epiphytica]
MLTTKAPNLTSVPYISVENMLKIINKIGIEQVFNDLVTYLEEDFKRWPVFDKTPRVAAHSQVGVIELMPTSDGEVYGFKYVNGHPKNQKEGLQTVTAFGVLANVSSGYPTLFTEMTILTALRTAATSAMVAKYLAPANAKTMALIGNGAQCEFQAFAFKTLCGIETIRLYDIDSAATDKVIKNLEGSGIELVRCHSAKEAVEGAEIITTCTADKQYATILTDDMITPGVHINAIGGDCPGKTELDKNILLRSDIFVEYTPQTRIEGDIQQLNQDHPVTEMWQVISGEARGRHSDEQITCFDGVGFAIEDFSALRYIYKQAIQSGLHSELDIVADPEDSRNLFGMLHKSK